MITKYTFSKNDDGEIEAHELAEGVKSMYESANANIEVPVKRGKPTRLRHLKGDNISFFAPPKRDDELAFLRKENEMLKKKVSKMEEEAVEAQMFIDDSSAEIDRLNDEIQHADANVTMWMSKAEEAHEACKKAEHERDVYKELMRNQPGAKKFTARQTAMIGYALCKKAGVVPANKKKISPMFNGISGYSANTMGQNLCSTFTDEEIEKVASEIEKDMPEFAAYLREKTFFLPDMKK